MALITSKLSITRVIEYRDEESSRAFNLGSASKRGSAPFISTIRVGQNGISGESFQPIRKRIYA
jgi:hypothetical protein